MTDTEERIANLQKLLDRVLTRGDAERGDEDGAAKSDAGDAADAKADAPKGDAKSEDGEEDEKNADAADETPPSDRPTPDVVSIADEADAKKEPLESRSRLVAAESTMELSEEDLIPESELPEAAMPLIRRSRTSGEMPVAEAPPSEGRILVQPHEVHVAGEALTDEERLAAEIAAEEVHSSELEEEEPTSSRRPIAAEARHTPPPESGRQVAALAADEGVASGKRKSSVPPAGGAPDVIGGGISVEGRVAVAAFRGAVTPDRPGSFGELIDWALEI